MKLWLYISFLFIFISASTGTLFSQSGTNQVTVIVASLTYISLNPTSLNMPINAANAIAGQNSMSITDQTSTLYWATNASPRKITISSTVIPAVPKFTLQIVAFNPTVGTPSAQVTLPTTAVDFITNIARTMGSCLLKYTATALASKGTGTDTHSVTFTVQTQ